MRVAGARFWLAGTLALAATAVAVEPALAPLPPPAAEFGADVQLAPFVVKGKKLSISIHARTPADRRYAEEFAEEVVAIAYETLGGSTGAGLVVMGREGEPHPVIVMRKFLAMAAAGQLDPAVAAKAGELTTLMADWKATFRLDEPAEGEEGFKLTFDMVVPALPLPLEGMSAKLYQLSWAEGFDDARIEQKLRSLTTAGLEGEALSQYDWVFYLPPKNAYLQVQTDIIKLAVKKEKIGVFKRTAMRSALFVFRSTVKAAVEAMRKGTLFMTVLRAQSDYAKDDIMALTYAYSGVLMPDFKINGGSQPRRALEAIEAQKIANAEYAKDPFISPARLAAYDPVAYAPFEGEYTRGKEGKGILAFKRVDEAYCWPYQAKDDKPSLFYPAGDRVLVSVDGKRTLEFKVDAQGAVTGVEERVARHRRTYPRKM